jgi:hypothetical protein
VSGVEKAVFGEEFSQPLGRLNMQPSGGFIRSATTGDSIHFAPPLTSRISYGAKLRLVFRSRPMNSRETVMPPRHNDEFRRVVLPEFKLHAFKPGLMSDLAISDQITAMHAPV